MVELNISHLGVDVLNANLVRDVSFSVKPGEVVAIIGPNGAGKTSLLRGILGVLPASGEVHIEGQNLRNLSPSKRARLISYLPQNRPLAWPNKVRDIVALGRFAYGTSLQKAGDDPAVSKAIEACDIAHLSERSADSLSGGEAARMHLARAFAAQTPLLIADEPVAALDPRHQLRVMSLIRDYVDQGHAALVILHDLSLAARFADKLIWMQEGEIIAQGSVTETLTEQRLRHVFGIETQIKDRHVMIEGLADRS